MAAIKLFFKMLRPQIALALLIFAAIGMAQGGKVSQLQWQFLWVTLIIVSWWINATCINDIADYEIDKINLKGSAERPLANKQASKQQIIYLYILSALSALGIGFATDIKIGILVAICLLLNYLYSMPPIRISYRGALASILLPVGYVLLPFLVGTWSVGDTLTHDGRLILAALYISFVGRILLKDFRDVEGDSKFGKMTFLLRYGRKATCISSALGLSVGVVILLFVLPDNFVVRLVFICLWLCTIFGLYKLYKTRGRKAELIIISSIVKSASGAVIILLAILLLENNQKPISQQVLVSAALGLYSIALFWDTISRVNKIYIQT